MICSRKLVYFISSRMDLYAFDALGPGPGSVQIRSTFLRWQTGRWHIEMFTYIRTHIVRVRRMRSRAPHRIAHMPLIVQRVQTLAVYCILFLCGIDPESYVRRV